MYYLNYQMLDINEKTKPHHISLHPFFMNIFYHACCSTLQLTSPCKSLVDSPLKLLHNLESQLYYHNFHNFRNNSNYKNGAVIFNTRSIHWQWQFFCCVGKFPHFNIKFARFCKGFTILSFIIFITLICILSNPALFLNLLII